MIVSSWRAPAGADARRRACGLLLALAVMSGGGAACGKKGAPLAPLVRLPGPPDGFTARRLGDTVFLQFSVPSKNQDNSTPGDLSAVELYGWTGAPPQNDEIVRLGTLVARVPVRPPPPPEEPRRDTRRVVGAGPRGAGAPSAKAVAAAEPGYDQGAVVIVTETLTPALVQPAVSKPAREPRGPAVSVTPPVFPPTARADDVPARSYVAVGVSHKGRRGAFSPRLAVPVVPAPLPPGAPTFAYNETTLTIGWPPPSDAPALPASPPAAPAGEPRLPPSHALVPLAAPAPAYDLYVVARDAITPGGAATPAIPVPLNPKPLGVPSTAVPVEFGVERCFAVRAVRAFGRATVASPLSPIGCLTPRDTFPPAPPKGLSAVVSAGEVSLAWEPNGESDLAGYLVLRGQAEGGPMQPLTSAPIAETSCEDRTAKPGVRYVYAVVAVDKAGNLSAQSNRIEETAR